MSRTKSKGAAGAATTRRQGERARAAFDQAASCLADASRDWAETLTREGWRYEAEFKPRELAQLAARWEKAALLQRTTWEQVTALLSSDAAKRIQEALPRHLSQGPNLTLMGPVTDDGEPTRSGPRARWVRLDVHFNQPVLRVDYGDRDSEDPEGEMGCFGIEDAGDLAKQSDEFVRALHKAFVSGATYRRLAADVRRLAHTLRRGAAKPEAVWEHAPWGDSDEWMKYAASRKGVRGTRAAPKK